MNFHKASLLVLGVLFLVEQIVICELKGASFYDNYQILSGHSWNSSQGKEIQITLDNENRGGTVFQSKTAYGSGFFHMNLKIPKNSPGVVTAFYLTSDASDHHDELDFEFLGNYDGKPIFLQTNVIAGGVGDREQRVQLWFDPTTEYHAYKILWNPYQIVFMIDEYPIRVYKNNQAIGVGYPSQPMQVKGSIWNGDDWATDGGLTKINWGNAPFVASFQSFVIKGCPVYDSNMRHCTTDRVSWNREKYRQLDASHQKAYEEVKNKYMTYDYCTDRRRYPTSPPECPQ